MSENNTDYLEINLREIFYKIWYRKVLIISITFIFAVFSVGYSLTLPDIYKSRALLSPASPEDSLNSKLSGYSSLAGLAGVSIPGTNASKTDEAIERIKSFSFFNEYFLPEIDLADLMAVSDWDKINNILIYDKSIYDVGEKKWIQKTTPKKNFPSIQNAYFVYKNILDISVNNSNSFVTISIEHKSPVIAKRWVEIIINKINYSMRKEDREQAENSINFLNESSKTINIQSLKEAITNLLETQMKTLMLATANESYVFKILDYPIEPENKSKPNRSIISIIGAIFGFIVSILISLLLPTRKLS